MARKSKKSKKDRIPKELILLLLGSAGALAGAVYLLTRPKTTTTTAPAAPKIPVSQLPNPLPPPPPGSYNASIALPVMSTRSAAPNITAPGAGPVAAAGPRPESPESLIIR